MYTLARYDLSTHAYTVVQAIELKKTVKPAIDATSLSIHHMCNTSKFSTRCLRSELLLNLSTGGEPVKVQNVRTKDFLRTLDRIRPIGIILTVLSWQRPLTSTITLHTRPMTR